MTKLIVLFQRIAFSLEIWTKICFITRSEFIAYKPPRGESVILPPHKAGAKSTANSKTTSSSNIQTTPQTNNIPAPPKYNSRSSTVEKRAEYADNKSESKGDKEAKAISNLKGKIVTLEQENKELRASQKKKLDEIKIKSDDAKVRAESKFEEKETKLNQKIELTESKLQNATSKIEELTKELKMASSKSIAHSQQAPKPGPQQAPKPGPVTPAVATNSAVTDAGTIASEYLKLTSVIQNTEKEIISNRLKTETTIALLREDEAQKLKVF
jgi:hypothetical protein